MRANVMQRELSVEQDRRENFSLILRRQEKKRPKKTWRESKKEKTGEKTGKKPGERDCEKCWMQVSPVPACEECPQSACLPFSRRRIRKRFPVFSPAIVKTITKNRLKSLLEGILAEKREARELKERQEARELKERQEARELKERQETREYELERLRLSNATETVSVSSADLEGQGAGDKEKVAEDRWVPQLIPLLPIEIAEIVAKRTFREKRRLPPHKNLLLARFQLTPIALRDRFESHQRRPGAM
ncbi:uncharacterized protein TNCV_895961 [Trichonephila clavipes]|nr:uncharacterized protein TNCV_895961 [Trichonephila clavipes]